MPLKCSQHILLLAMNKLHPTPTGLYTRLMVCSRLQQSLTHCHGSLGVHAASPNNLEASNPEITDLHFSHSESTKFR